MLAGRRSPRDRRSRGLGERFKSAETHGDWQAHVRRQDVWEQCQAERALEVGLILLPWFVQYRGSVRELLADHPSAGRWAEEEIRADRVRAKPVPKWLKTFLAGDR